MVVGQREHCNQKCLHPSVDANADGKGAALVPYRRKRTFEVAFSCSIYVIDFGKIHKIFRLPLTRRSLTVSRRFAGPSPNCESAVKV
jgi:hypothetical protein